MESERIRTKVWLTVVGVLAVACTVTYLAVASAPDPTELAEQPVARSGAPRHTQRPFGGSQGWNRRPPTQVLDAGAPLSPEEREAIEDPQLAASHRSYPESDAGVPASFAPLMRIAHVTSVSGNAEVDVGERCELRVLPVMAGGFNCLARVQCGGSLLYPDPSQRAGYVACQLSEWGSPQHAQDHDVTGDDGDPALLVDLPSLRVEVRDGGPFGNDFAAVLRIDPLPRFTAQGLRSGHES